MENNILIKNGMVMDGTGTPAVAGVGAGPADP